MRLYKYWHKDNPYNIFDTYRLDCIDDNIGIVKELLLYCGFKMKVGEYYVRKARRNER